MEGTKKDMIETVVHRGVVLLIVAALGTNAALIGQAAGRSTWEIIGGIATLVLAVLEVGRRLNNTATAIHRDFLLVRVEHEELMIDYCERTGKVLAELPTRKMGGFLR